MILCNVVVIIVVMTTNLTLFNFIICDYYIWLEKEKVRKEKETSNLSSKTRGAAAPRTRITCTYFLGSEEPLLKLSRLAKLQLTNYSPNSNCRRSKSAIFISRNINSNIHSLLRLRVGTHIIYIYIYIYISIYLSDERYIPEVEMKTI